MGLRDVRHAGIIAESKFNNTQKRNAYKKITGLSKDTGFNETSPS